MGAPKGAVAVAEVPYWHLLQEKGMLSVNTWYCVRTTRVIRTIRITRVVRTQYQDDGSRL
jgi:hypothetical protein